MRGNIEAAPRLSDHGRDRDSRKLSRRIQTVNAEGRTKDAGSVNTAVLDIEVKPYFQRLRGCLIEVARRKQVLPDSLPVGEVQLSWTILPNGVATNATALADADADLEVLHCVGQQMFGWRFTPPDGGPAHATYQVTLTRSSAGRLAAAAAPGRPQSTQR